MGNISGLFHSHTGQRGELASIEGAYPEPPSSLPGGGEEVDCDHVFNVVQEVHGSIPDAHHGHIIHRERKPLGTMFKVLVPDTIDGQTKHLLVKLQCDGASAFHMAWDTFKAEFSPEPQQIAAARQAQFRSFSSRFRPTTMDDVFKHWKADMWDQHNAHYRKVHAYLPVFCAHTNDDSVLRRHATRSMLSRSMITRRHRHQNTIIPILVHANGFRLAPAPACRCSSACS